MRTSLTSLFRPIALSIGAIAVIGLGQLVVKADEVFIAGNTAGCFGGCLRPRSLGTRSWG